MPVVDVNLNPSDKQLRQFGLIAMLALPTLGWLFCGKPTPSTWLPLHTVRIGTLAGVGLLAGLAGAIRPCSLKWVFVVLSLVTFPIGCVLGEVILIAVFTIAFVPLALWFRIVGRDALQRRADRRDSYWQPKARPQNAASYFRQF